MQDEKLATKDKEMAEKSTHATPGLGLGVKMLLLALLFFGLGVLTVLLIQRFQFDFGTNEDYTSFQQTYQPVDRAELADIVNPDAFDEFLNEQQVAGETTDESTQPVE